MKHTVSSWHISISAEAFVAGQFARCRYDVSVQYGANQPEYDLIVVKGEKTLKVSVKGSQTGSWGIAQSYLKNADYYKAIESWLSHFKNHTVLCFVQFHQTSLNELPRMYLATPSEVAQRLRDSAKRRGATILYENRKWSSRAAGAGTIDKIPQAWNFSPERIEQLMSEA